MSLRTLIDVPTWTGVCCTVDSATVTTFTQTLCRHLHFSDRLNLSMNVFWYIVGNDMRMRKYVVQVQSMRGNSETCAIELGF
jgi:hypothetical protein